MITKPRQGIHHPSNLANLAIPPKVNDRGELTWRLTKCPARTVRWGIKPHSAGHHYFGHPCPVSALWGVSCTSLNVRSWPVAVVGRLRPNADIHDTTVNFHPRGHARQGSLGGNAGTDGVASWLRNRLTTTVQTPVPRSVHGLHRWRMPFQSTLSFHRSL